MIGEELDFESVERLERRGDLKAAINMYRDALVRVDEPAQKAVLHLRIGRCLLETELDEAADRLAEARREATSACLAAWTWSRRGSRPCEVVTKQRPIASRRRTAG